MNFTELAFLGCLVPSVILFYCLPLRWRSYYLLILSYLFYFTWSVPYSILMFALTLLVYFLARIVDRAPSDRTKSVAILSAVVLLTGILAFFKSLSIQHSDFAGHLIVPLGISYYTFKLISYVLDVYRDKIRAEKNFAELALYVAFFPQILCGPIQRAPDFLQQVRTRLSAGLNSDLVEHGIGFILLGLLEKLAVADRIAPFIAQVDGDLALQSGRTVLLSVYAYTFQLFSDFSALTLIALGIGMLFGIQGPPNFDRPFAAIGIQNFWRRWHMSLTSWLGDYLFMPLRMAFRSWGSWGLSISIFVYMALIGLWHGIRPNYLVFGLIHGVFMVSSFLTSRRRNAFFEKHAGWEFQRKVWGQVLTFHMVSFAFIFFRASSLDASILMLQKIAHTGGASSSDVIVGKDMVRSVVAASFIALIAGYGLFSRRLEDFIIQLNGRTRYIAYGLTLFAIVLLGVVEGGQFIYARF